MIGALIVYFTLNALMALIAFLESIGDNDIHYPVSDKVIRYRLYGTYAFPHSIYVYLREKIGLTKIGCFIPFAIVYLLLLPSIIIHELGRLYIRLFKDKSKESK